MSSSLVPEALAIKALQKLFRAFTGRELPYAKAKLLLEQTGND